MKYSKYSITILLFLLFLTFFAILSHVEAFNDNKTYIYSNYNKNDQGKTITFDVVTQPLLPNSQSHL